MIYISDWHSISFSLLQIVNFRNQACSADTGDTGHCVSASECLARGGAVRGGAFMIIKASGVFVDIMNLPPGSCAQNFGSCCLLIVSSCGGILPYNCSYLQWDITDSLLRMMTCAFRNPGYANEYNTETSCNWSFRKSRSDVCMIRLDFDHFEISAPESTGRCTDYFQATNAATGRESQKCFLWA